MKSVWSKVITAAAVLLLFAAFFAIPASAAQPPLVDLGYSEKFSRTFTKYDVTGDGTPDKISIGLGEKQEEGYYRKLIVRINGKAAFTKWYTYEGTFGARVMILRLTGGRVYVFIKDSMGDFCSLCSLFRYVGGKLVKSFDLRTMGGIYPKGKLEYPTGLPLKVSGNYITCSAFFQCPALAGTGFNVKLVLKSGKLQLASRYIAMKGINGSEPNAKYKLRETVPAYATAKAAKAGRFFKKGSLVRVTTMVFGDGFIRFRIVNASGRSGYISVLRNVKTGGLTYPLFEGLDYAG